MSRTNAERAAVFLMGPTAVGKTALAVELVRRLPLQIVSVDSAMVYRGMDIGTGKPDARVLAQAPHRLIDIRDPEEGYSAGEFRRDALREMEAIVARGEVPLLVGGTGLYFRALREGLASLPPAERTVRERLSSEAGLRGWDSLHRRLAALDPESAARIHPNDPQRIQRALEVYELTGSRLSDLHQGPAETGLEWPVLPLVLFPRDRAVLHERIGARFERMLAHGLVEEVEALRARPGVSRELPAMRAVGYRQVWDYLEGRIAREVMVRRAVTATRQLAKRQLTWLRAQEAAVRIEDRDAGILDKVLRDVEKFIR